MNFSAKRRNLLVLLAVVFGLTFAFTATANARPDVSRDLLNPGVLVVGSDVPYAPFEFGKAPHYKGFDIDLVKALAHKLNLQLRIKDTPFDTIFIDVNKRKFDLVASAATIVPERKRVVKFSRPYYDAQQSIVVRKNSRIRSVRDLSGKVVGVQSGTTGAHFAYDETKAKKVVRFSRGHGALKAVRKGRVDAVVIDQPVASALVNSRSKLRIARSFSVGQKYGLAVSKRSTKLLRGVNWALRKIMKNGTHKRLYRKWFGVNPPKSLRR